ncbi:hypothetical protein J2T17_004935 [Paenibacillus mucilaginosus]|uniref:hypothetical protein n=1 Tax=Paenibacillus mucilaginosus TaxID=61624 RepID=UPI003D1EFAA8
MTVISFLLPVLLLGGGSGNRPGKKLGETALRIAGKVDCSAYPPAHGDATMLPEGTAVHEAGGYAKTFRLLAGGRVYEVMENPEAKTLGEQYDIAGKVEYLTIRKDTDMEERRFDSELTERLTELYLQRERIGEPEILKRGVPKAEYVYNLEFHLRDGSEVRTTYLSGSEYFGSGALLGSELEKALKDITQKEFGRP